MINDIDEDSNVDADTRLDNLDMSRLNDIETDVNTGQINNGLNNQFSVFAANNLVRKTSDNLAEAEARTNEVPLRTEKTAELERIEKEDNTY